jgi:hypothetical protein
LNKNLAYLLIVPGVLLLIPGIIAFFYPSWADIVMENTQPPPIEHPYRYTIGLPLIIASVICLVYGIFTLAKSKQPSIDPLKKN